MTNFISIIMCNVGRAHLIPLQWARRATAHSQRRNMGIQQRVHSVYSALFVRSARMDGLTIALRLGLFERSSYHSEIPRNRRRPTQSPIESVHKHKQPVVRSLQGLDSFGCMCSQRISAKPSTFAIRFVHCLLDHTDQSSSLLVRVTKEPLPTHSGSHL